MSAELAGLRLHREASAVERVQGQTAAAAVAGHLAARKENFFAALNISSAFFFLYIALFIKIVDNHLCQKVVAEFCFKVNVIKTEKEGVDL